MTKPSAPKAIRPRRAADSEREAGKGLIDPAGTSGLLVADFLGKSLTSDHHAGIMDAIGEHAKAVAAGDTSGIEAVLVGQVFALNAMFADLSARAALNRGDYPEAFERYMRLGLKAQAQCRASIEALAHMHQPREQVVRHVHVYEGGQAVVAEQLHLHGSGARNAEIVDQAHAQSSRGPALLRHDEIGQHLPIAGGPGKARVPDARRGRGKRRTTGKQQCMEARCAVGGDAGVGESASNDGAER